MVGESRFGRTDNVARSLFASPPCMQWLCLRSFGDRRQENNRVIWKDAKKGVFSSYIFLFGFGTSEVNPLSDGHHLEYMDPPKEGKEGRCGELLLLAFFDNLAGMKLKSI
ncbi:hypothetical protein CK203_068400 [Vitis vinifera]|uniref:Uncharacterized protein n=1 Tax=Vitis vinifera TaxID=29760 RepID=A0A438F3G1_VITVI|nr:hypothetical protein CK203_068400 [Vitis vinifera]